jgi:hypothetical protein
MLGNARYWRTSPMPGPPASSIKPALMRIDREIDEGLHGGRQHIQDPWSHEVNAVDGGTHIERNAVRRSVQPVDRVPLNVLGTCSRRVANKTDVFACNKGLREGCPEFQLRQ